MIYIIVLLLFLLLYFDNQSSIIIGGTGDRSRFQMLLIIFVVYVLINGLYYGMKRKKIYFSSISKPIFLLTIIILLKNLVEDSHSSYDNLRFLYSAAWLIIVVGFDNIFMSMSEKSKKIFDYLMPCLFLYTVYNSLQTFSYLSVSKDVFVIPTVYLCVMFIPWLLQLYTKKRLLFGFFILILLIITAVSAKRGAILATFLSLLIFFYNSGGYRTKGKRMKLVQVILFSLLGIFILLIVDDSLGGTLSARFSKNAITDGSGRREINEFALESIANISSLKELFFGYSFDSYELLHFGGHNDWLTFMLIHGLVGVGAFAYFYYVFYCHSFKNKQYSISSSYSSLFVIMILQSLYSTSYNPTVHPLLGMMFIGYAEAQIRKEKIRKA